jgi:oxygen-independent coproporphyrinogen-3 oxidase
VPSAADVVGSLDGPAGLYLHVPFCERICPFCPYNKVRADDGLARRYFAALGQEIAWVADAAAVRGEPFTSVYVGGGTPTLYPDEVGALLGPLPVAGEQAIEVLPNHATLPRLDQLAGLGFDAVSVGAQSFHDGVLRRLGRPHDAATARVAVENVLGRFRCVDVDLIVDVAWDDSDAFPGAFLADLTTCLDLGVDQVSTYPLMRFGYTPFGAARHDARREHQVLAQATELARAHGYERRSVWTFNRRGAPAYTSVTRRRFLGVGAGSSSFTGRDFWVNHFGVGTYAAAVEQGRLPVARHLRLGRFAGAAYDGFWQAYAGRVDPALLAAAYGPLVAALARGVLGPARLAGLVEHERGQPFVLTSRGLDAYHDLERAVTYQLIEPLWAEMLAEHEQEPSAGGRGAGWVLPQRARHGRVWGLARRAFERSSPAAPVRRSLRADAPGGRPRGTTRSRRRPAPGTTPALAPSSNAPGRHHRPAGRAPSR